MFELPFVGVESTLGEECFLILLGWKISLERHVFLYFRVEKCIRGHMLFVTFGLKVILEG